MARWAFYASTLLITHFDYKMVVTAKFNNKLTFDMAFLDFIDPIGRVVGGLIGAGSSLIGSSKSYEAQKEANELNYKMFKEQLGFTEDMWQKSNEYNSAKNQRKRIEDAGLNPYLMLDGGSAGTAESVTAPSGNPMQPADALGQGVQQAGRILGDTLQSAGQSFLLTQQINSAKEDVRARTIDNLYRIDHHINQLVHEQRENDNLIHSRTLTDAQRDEAVKRKEELDEQIWQYQQQRRFYSRMLQARTEREEKEAVGVELRNSYQEMMNRAFPRLNAAQLNLLAQQASQAYQTAMLAKENQNVSKEEAKRIALQAAGEVISNGIKANEYDLSKLGLNEAELRALRAGNVRDFIQNNSVVRAIDSEIYHIVNLFGSALLGSAFGK